MMPLKDIQASFQDYLEGKDDTVLNLINAQGEASTITRMGVYRNAYYARLTDILSNHYFVFQTLLGEAEFAKLAKAYILMHPPKDYAIRYVGGDFSEYLKAHLVDDPNREFYVELANFEWAMRDVLDAADACLMTVEALQQLDENAWPTLQVRLHPSVHILSLKYNTGEIWRAVTEKQSVPTVSELPETRQCLLWRWQLQPYFFYNEPLQALIIDSIRANKNFTEICETICSYFEEEDQAVQFAVQYLFKLAGSGILAGSP